MTSVAIEAFYDAPTGSWTYVVARGGVCAVIDSVLGFDVHSGKTDTKSADKVISFIKDKGLRCEWVIETHIHADHLSAMAHVQKTLGGKTGITVKVLDSLKLWAPFFGMKDVPMDGTQFDMLFDEKGFTLGGEPVRVMFTPGHTPADTTFIIGDAAIVGDTLLMPDEGTGRCDFPGGSAADSWESIQKIFTLPDTTCIFVAHSYKDEPKSMATVMEHKAQNIRVKSGISREAYIEKRMADDKGKPVPKLIIPALQVNLRAGLLPANLTWPLNKL